VSLARRLVTVAFSAFLIATALDAVPSPAAAALPTAAVALGDSFISGEGAGAYTPVVDINGAARSFPGWSAPNSDAFFCHRSANASLLRADLAGACVTNFPTCQEFWHPNAEGHAVLGRCLTGAATTAARTVSCVRATDGTITVRAG